MELSQLKSHKPHTRTHTHTHTHAYVRTDDVPTTTTFFQSIHSNRKSSDQNENTHLLFPFFSSPSHQRRPLRTLSRTLLRLIFFSLLLSVCGSVLNFSFLSVFSLHCTIFIYFCFCHDEPINR